MRRLFGHAAQRWINAIIINTFFDCRAAAGGRAAMPTLDYAFRNAIYFRCHTYRR